MKILVLGAGQVGSTTASQLAREEANDVTVVDSNPAILRELQDRLDVRTVVGHAAYPETLERAGVADADILIAVTTSDEVNMTACQVAWSLYETPTKIARVRGADYLKRDDLFAPERIPVDFCISPEQLVTHHIEQLIRYPGAFQVLDFADGRVRLIGARAQRGGPLVGQPIRTLREHIPGSATRIAAIYRDGESVVPEGSTVIRENDEVFFVSTPEEIRAVMREMHREENPVRKVMIAGGGNIGYRVAQLLEDTNRVKIIERSRERAKTIAEPSARPSYFRAMPPTRNCCRENIDSTDVFVALTDAEEVNILSAVLAKRRLSQGNGAHQPAFLRRTGRGRENRRRHLAARDHHRRPARLCATVGHGTRPYLRRGRAGPSKPSPGRDRLVGVGGTDQPAGRRDDQRDHPGQQHCRPTTTPWSKPTTTSSSS